MTGRMSGDVIVASTRYFFSKNLHSLTKITLKPPPLAFLLDLLELEESKLFLAESNIVFHFVRRRARTRRVLEDVSRIAAAVFDHSLRVLEVLLRLAAEA